MLRVLRGGRAASAGDPTQSTVYWRPYRSCSSLSRPHRASASSSTASRTGAVPMDRQCRSRTGQRAGRNADVLRRTVPIVVPASAVGRTDRSAPQHMATRRRRGCGTHPATPGRARRRGTSKSSVKGRSSHDSNSSLGPGPTAPTSAKKSAKSYPRPAPKPGHDPTTLAKVGGEAAEHLPGGCWVEERHDVAGAHHDVEPLRDALAGRSSTARSPTSQAGPSWSCSAAVISTGSMSTPTTSCPAAARWRPPGRGRSRRRARGHAAGHHGVDEACLTGQVVAGCGHRSEALHVPGRVRRVLPGELDPPTGLRRAAVGRGRHRNSLGATPSTYPVWIGGPHGTSPGVLVAARRAP